MPGLMAGTDTFPIVAFRTAQAYDNDSPRHGLSAIWHRQMEDDVQVSSLPEVNSHQLRAVLAVAEYRSFIAAAAFLKTSQPALTRTIKNIEGTLGASLFSRSTRQVSITEAGKEFAALADRLLNDLKIGIESVRGLAEQQRGRIIVSSVMSAAHVALPKVIAEYNRTFPGIEIHLREGVHGNVQDDVRSGLADFGLGYVADMPAPFTTESLGAEAFYVVLPSRHRLSRAKEIELKALKDAALVSLPSDARTRRIVDGAAATAGFTFRHVVTVNQFATLFSFVRNGVGVTIVPEGARPARDRELVSRPLIRPRLSREIGIIRLRDRELTPAAAGLLALVTQQLRRPRRLFGSIKKAE
jgi:DNA-binding transcriptional LysR family regulator